MELAEGADADLVRTNRRLFRLAFSLIGLALALTAIDAKVRLPKSLDTVLRIVAVCSFVIDFVMGRWARAERAFLNRADPEVPPEIFRSNS